MPLSKAVLRPFTKNDILSLNPNQYGVYAIFCGSPSNSWVYIGRGDIRTRMLAHINGDIPEIFKYTPHKWAALIYAEAEQIVLEKQMILKYQPLCNKKVG